MRLTIATPARDRALISDVLPLSQVLLVSTECLVNDLTAADNCSLSRIDRSERSRFVSIATRLTHNRLLTFLNIHGTLYTYYTLPSACLVLRLDSQTALVRSAIPPVSCESGH